MQIDDGGAAWAPAAGHYLVAPSPSEPLPDLAQAILGWQSFVSPTYCINWAISQICDVDPFAWLTEWFTGDWEEFSKAGDALTHLDGWTATTRAQLDGVAASLSFGWKGNAADAAQAYFADLAAALTTVETALAGLATDFQSTATGVWMAGQAAVSALAELCDWLIILALELVAAAGTSWTIVGGIAAGAAAAATALKAASVWRQVVTWHGRAVAGAEAFAGLAAGNLALIHGLEGLRLPGGTLDVPGAGR